MVMDTLTRVRFGFMTDEEVRKQSVKRITRPDLFEHGLPTQGGLYDPALGPLKERDRSLCVTCGQTYDFCPGHCGHIELITEAYHPLMFNMLCKIFQRTCFSCYHFRARPFEVEDCVSRLKCILEGDMVRAGKPNSPLLSLKNKDSMIECGLVDSVDLMTTDDEFHSDGEQYQQEISEQKGWTSWQLSEALSVLDGFLKKKLKKCPRCAFKNPPIIRPNLGMIRLGGLSDENTISNIIRGCTLRGPLADGYDDKSTSDLENVDDPLPSAKKKKKGRKEGAEFIKHKATFSQTLYPNQVKKILVRLWENEARLCSFLCDIQQQQPYTHWKNAGCSMFFLKSVLVPPLKYRPPSFEANMMTEHAQTSSLVAVVEANMYAINAFKNNAEGNAFGNKSLQHSEFVTRSFALQRSINVLYDARTGNGIDAVGICQLLDRKEGVFRQKMMGKRVNFACRSVISPDPYLAVNEIGLPLTFALKLTYPEKVTPWNVVKLRNAVFNGPDVHPGATNYIDKVANVKLPLLQKRRVAISRRLFSSRGVVTGAVKSSSDDYEGKVVLRHIQNGDIVLVNRQPTLHKPSIIAMKVRVLPGEKTLRMHYANCDSFNADFDGDEINVHFPQDEISRAEAYNIVHADDQYIVPTRGDPKRALIQDHIVSAVLLTKKDTFLTLEEFNELIYSSGVCSWGSRTSYPKPGQKVSVLDNEDSIESLPPAIVKPQRLWSGKQVITAILDHITKGELPFTVKKRAKIAREYFGKGKAKSRTGEDEASKSKIRKDKEAKLTTFATIDPVEAIDEDVVLVYKNELVQGVIDKDQFAKYGLVHTVHELYGPNTAGKLLSVLGRVLTTFLQIHGFTCGVDDLLLKKEEDKHRNELLENALNCGEKVHLKFINREKESLGFDRIQTEVEKAISRNGESSLDGEMRKELVKSSTALGNLMPDGLVKPFRRNWLSMMTVSGAKGSTFNFQQISLLLGQQELEGKRVPRMGSGKTLPCFPPWDTSARAGGFIADRFLTGLRPQEFFLHCMAGREGLVDTAVKTARSGYLQRCLIKNLESLRVNYDYTVRDADGSIVQFRYGEDGVDVHRKNFIEQFDALAMNQEILQKKVLSQTDSACMSEYTVVDNEYADKLVEKAGVFAKNKMEASFSGLKPHKDLTNFSEIVKSKYFLSLAQPGEPVGVIAAQSVGEPSTQMTLNTFHHAGRGDVNVTLGIPRLQEILMTASATIRTPTMTCPGHKYMNEHDAENLAAKFRRVSVASLMEKMEVVMLPYDEENNRWTTVYKLKIKLYEPEIYPSHINISMKDCTETLNGLFLTKLEEAIDHHLALVYKVRGIADFVGDSDPKSSLEDDGEEPKESQNNGDDNENDAVNEDAEDVDADVLKRKTQGTDEMDYEDVAEHGLLKEKQEDEVDIEKHESEMESEVDQGEINDDDKDDDDENTGGDEPPKSKVELHRQEGASRKGKKKKERVFFVASEGVHFEFHIRFRDDPHILLSQIAQQTAKNVFVKNSGEIEKCTHAKVPVDEMDEETSTCLTSGIPMLKSKERWGLKTAGVDFCTFWEMQDSLDIRFIYSNDIHAMLNTYGVEAARLGIITEVYRVFRHYGVEVDMRHLSLIADYMTHHGGYRPMSRSGAIAESVSPLLKMSYETSSKFAVQAANYGLVDNMETPSARIALGLPAKVGTGCFDLFQELQLDI
ncbi:hypothetical protein Drorol1_Dr00012747 [Drosera rotundifolia]